MNIVCRKARKQFAALVVRSGSGAREKLSVTERAALERHLQSCERCTFEYRIYSLGQATLNAAASPEAVAPDEDFFKALRARIARGPEVAAAPQQDESWAGALLVIARQMVPAMAMLLLLIVGATLLWKSSPSRQFIRPANADQAMRSPDRANDFAEPTPDDVLESFVAVEERWDGK